MGLLVGKVVLITGAGRGIGRAAALACARQGARVVVNDLGCDAGGDGADPSVAEAVCEELRGAGAEAVANAEDVTAGPVPDALIELCRSRFGRVDAVFHAAGIAHERVLARLQDDALDRMLAVQLRAAIRLARAASVAMQAQPDGGALLLCSSQGAFVGQREQTAACAASAGVVGFVRAAAVELRRHRVRINALCPLARTRLTEGSPMFQALRHDSLLPAHVAAVVTYLLSPLSAEVTGECIGAAGGRVYVQRLNETTGALLDEQTLDAQAVADAWPQITRA